MSHTKGYKKKPILLRGDDADAAVAKTGAIKNIQLALTARILKRLDSNQPLIEVARKMKVIEGMQPQINDIERRLGIMQRVAPVISNAVDRVRHLHDKTGIMRDTFYEDMKAYDRALQVVPIISCSEYDAKACQMDTRCKYENKSCINLQPCPDSHPLLFPTRGPTAKLMCFAPLPMEEKAEFSEALRNMNKDLELFNKRMEFIKETEKVLHTTIKHIFEVVDVRGMR